MLLLVQEQDLPNVRDLMNGQWSELVDAENASCEVESEWEGEGPPPCPACGTAAELVGGACSDCGLQLA